MGFVSLNTGLSALSAQQHGLDVTGQNIANANTDGYSRQRVRLEATGGLAAAAIFSRSLTPGGGVRALGFERLRDAFLDARALQEHATDASLRTTQSVLSRLELSFAEPGDNGIQEQLAAFWAGWDDVANRPGDTGARVQLLELGRTVAASFTRVAHDLASLRDASRGQLEARVNDVNQAAERIAELNTTIQSAVNAGLSPNDLLDQRDRLIGDLAGLAGVTTRPGDAGTADVFIGGTALVRGSTVDALAVTAPDAAGTVEVRWGPLGPRADLGGGELAGLVDAVDETLPVWQHSLDDAACSVRDTVNRVQAEGFDQAGAAGTPMFSGAGAGDLAVALEDPAGVAARAGTWNGGTPPAWIPAEGTLGGGNALRAAGLGGASSWEDTVTHEGGLAAPDGVYRTLVNALGTAVQRVDRKVELQTRITAQVDSARQAQAGVNLDEEMTNMLMFQRAYQAAARFMASVDETLDTLLRIAG